MSSMTEKKAATGKKEKIKIKRDTNIAQLVFKYPIAAEVMLGFGLHCASCFASHFDTIYEGAKLHGMPDEEIDEMIDELEKVLSGEAELGE